VQHAAARGASNRGFTFHDRGGPFGCTKGAKRVVAVDVTGLPLGALVVPVSTHENRASELMLEHLAQQGSPGASNWPWRTVGSPRPLPARSAGTTTSSCAGSGGTLELRDGMGLERFYESCGWHEIGRWPQALCLGEDELREEVPMHLSLR
jgi:hypothetical protein